MGKVLEATLMGTRIGYHPSGVLLLSEWDAMLLADVHLGKAEFMQSNGIPLTSQSHQKDLEVFMELVAEHQVKNIFILGDLVHRPGQHPESFEELILRLESLVDETHWIQGNHDGNKKKELPKSWSIHRNHFDLGPFRLRHEALMEEDYMFQIYGHVHPCLKFGDGRDRLRLPCFALKSDRLLLPSFGVLTGGFELVKEEWEEFMICAGDQIMPMTSSKLQHANRKFIRRFTPKK